ncbi:MAG TPA: 30S ribosomal protein S9 [Phycisphaerae bacterium]|nr:30S ribosomal protein S9 [Phycisphaerae bacterium]
MSEKTVTSETKSAAAGKYTWGTGRRKASVARVRICQGSGKILVNKRELAAYFPHIKDQFSVNAPLTIAGITSNIDIWANVSGGGNTGQASAIKLGLARAIAKYMPEVERELRDKGLLTRDARSRERKKPGQPGARKRFQFSKR